LVRLRLVQETERVGNPLEDAAGVAQFAEGLTK
jgi:hypothetical protein